MNRANEKFTESLARLMESSLRTHREFKRQYSLWENGKLSAKYPHSEAPEVTTARDDWWRANNILFSTKLGPLEIAFRDRPHDAFDELCCFLATDIPAFRCGYAKELFLQRLKGIQFTTRERKKLSDIALFYCTTDTVRREFRRWCRLMVKIADEEDLKRLKGITESASGISRVKADWMLTTIIQHRLDLRE